MYIRFMYEYARFILIITCPIKDPSRMKNRSWFALGTCARRYIHTWTIYISGDNTHMHQIH